MAPPEKAEFAYNQIQVFVAIIIALLTAIDQYLKYKETSSQIFPEKNNGADNHCSHRRYIDSCFGDVNYKKETYGFHGCHLDCRGL